MPMVAMINAASMRELEFISKALINFKSELRIVIQLQR